MKNILLILLLSIPICYAQPQENLAISPSYDSLEAAVDNLDKKIDSLNGKFLSDKFVTVEALEKMQEFYSNSFSHLLAVLAIAIAIFIGLLVFFNIRFEKFLDRRISDSEKKFKKQLENQQKLFDEEFKTQKEKNEFAIEDLHKQLARSYFESAVYAHDVNEYDIENVKYMKYIKSHLIQLNSYFISVANLKLELNIDDLFFLEKVGSYIEGYKYIPKSFVQFFSTGLKKFIDYCKTSEKRKFEKEENQDFIEKAEKIWQVFLEKFDNGDIDNLIEEYKKMDINERISMKHKAMRDSSNEEVRWANDYEK